MLAGEQKEKFIEFYNRGEGGVDISDKQAQQLQNYMREKKSIYDRAVFDAMTKLYQKENKQSNEASEKGMLHEYEMDSKQSKLLQQEIDLNMEEAYRQLGKKKQTVLNTPSGNFVAATISTPGWKNVDAYVTESTIARTTLNFTDKETGKKAVIEYKKAEVVVKDFEKYDRVVCYLLPDKLSTFQFMKNTANVFSENLNMTFAYSMITVGYKGDKAYYEDVKHVQPKVYETNLKEVDTETLVRTINRRYNFTGTSDIIKDLDFNAFKQTEVVRWSILL